MALPSLSARRGTAAAAAVAMLGAAALAIGQASEPVNSAADPAEYAASAAGGDLHPQEIPPPGLHRQVQSDQAPGTADPSQPPTAPAAAPQQTPIPTPQSSPEDLPVEPVAYRPGPGLHTEAVLALVVEHFPADQVGNAMAVARCESGHSNAIGAANRNGTRDWGVFQLNDGGTLQGALRRIGVPFNSTIEAQGLALDAAVNVRAAASIYQSRGWAPWVCAYKAGIVASLYSSTPGPMDGRYDERGLPGDVDLSRTVPDADADIPQPAVTDAPPPTPSTPATPPAPPAPTSPEPAETAEPSPAPAETASASPTPAASDEPSTAPSESPTPEESATPDPAPSEAEATTTATPGASATSTAGAPTSAAESPAGDSSDPTSTTNDESPASDGGESPSG